MYEMVALVEQLLALVAVGDLALEETASHIDDDIDAEDVCVSN